MSTTAIAPDIGGTYDLTLGPSPSPSDYTSDYTPVVPSSDDLGAAMAAAAGVPFMPQTGSNVSDPSGVNATNNDPTTNPNPTGGWQATAQNIINAAAKGFSTFVNGSPSAGIPAARTVTGSRIGGPLTTTSGGTNWALIGVVVLVAGIGIWALVKYA